MRDALDENSSSCSGAGSDGGGGGASPVGRGTVELRRFAVVRGGTESVGDDDLEPAIDIDGADEAAFSVFSCTGEPDERDGESSGASVFSVRPRVGVDAIDSSNDDVDDDDDDRLVSETTLDVAGDEESVAIVDSVGDESEVLIIDDDALGGDDAAVINVDVGGAGAGGGPPGGGGGGMPFAKSIRLLATPDASNSCSSAAEFIVAASFRCEPRDGECWRDDDRLDERDDACERDVRSLL